MALVVENGTIVDGANSIVSRAGVISYALARGVVLADDETTDIAIIQAMDYLWTLCFKGIQHPDASTPFPRIGLVEGDLAVDYVHTIPAGMKRAVMQLALDVHNGIDLTPSGVAEAGIKKEKVGPIETEFYDPSSNGLGNDPRLVLALAWLGPFLCSDSGFALITVRA